MEQDKTVEWEIARKWSTDSYNRGFIEGKDFLMVRCMRLLTSKKFLEEEFEANFCDLEENGYTEFLLFIEGIREALEEAEKAKVKPEEKKAE